MALCSFLSVLLIHITLFVSLCYAADPFVNYEFEVSYITASPLGVPQQVYSSDLFLSLLLVKIFMWVCLIFMDEKWVGFIFPEV